MNAPSAIPHRSGSSRLNASTPSAGNLGEQLASVSAVSRGDGRSSRRQLQHRLLRARSCRRSPAQRRPHGGVGGRGRHMPLRMMVRDRRHTQLHAVRSKRWRQALDKGDHSLRRHRQDHRPAMAGAPSEEALPGPGIDPSRLQAEPASRQAGSSSMTVCRTRFVLAAGHERGWQVELLRDPAGAEPTTPGRHPASGEHATTRQLLIASI